MPALYAYTAGMRKIQYTIRRVPGRLDGLARGRARKSGKSINETLLEALGKGLGVPDEPVRHPDLDDLAGSWVHDPEFDRALEEMDRIDPDLWK
jgi:hypothetical protein